MTIALKQTLRRHLENDIKLLWPLRFDFDPQFEKNNNLTLKHARLLCWRCERSHGFNIISVFVRHRSKMTVDLIVGNVCTSVRALCRFNVDFCVAGMSANRTIAEAIEIKSEQLRYRDCEKRR